MFILLHLVTHFLSTNDVARFSNLDDLVLERLSVFGHFVVVQWLMMMYRIIWRIHTWSWFIYGWFTLFTHTCGFSGVVEVTLCTCHHLAGMLSLRHFVDTF